MLVLHGPAPPGVGGHGPRRRPRPARSRCRPVRHYTSFGPKTKARAHQVKFVCLLTVYINNVSWSMFLTSSDDEIVQPARPARVG